MLLDSFILKIKRAETPYYARLKKIGKAILTATAQGDSGTEVRYLEIVGNGLANLPVLARLIATLTGSADTASNE